MTQLQDQTLALASMFQSATMINQLAHGQHINQAAFDCSLDSLFTMHASSIDEIYGGGDGLIPGIKALVSYMSGQNRSPDRLVAYYVLSMIKLEQRLLKNQPLVDRVQQGLEDIEKQTRQFEMSQLAKVHKIDGLYQDTISQIKPRIIVQGDQAQLSQSDNTSKIRALLFSGIRAAVLWRQRGGSRWKLIFLRKKYVQQAERLLQRF